MMISAPRRWWWVLGLMLGCSVWSGVQGHGCDRTDNDHREASRVIGRLTGEINEMERAIIEALRLQTGQLSGYHAQSTKALVHAIDTQTKLQSQIAREVEETESLREHAVSDNGCAGVTGFTGLRHARVAADQAKARAVRSETGRIIDDRAVTSGGGGAADTAARFATMTSVYCNAGRSGDRVCRGASEQHGVDLRTETLFDRRTFASAEELRAAVALSRNLAAPVVYDPLPLGSAETDQERRLVMRGRAADARAALSVDYFAHARGLRAPGPDLGAWAAAVAPGVMREGEQISRYALLELLASGRFEDPNWYVRLQAMSAPNLLRELVALQSIGLMLDWQRFRIDERRGAMEAAALAIAGETMRDRLPGLSNPASQTN